MSAPTAKRAADLFQAGQLGVTHELWHVQRACGAEVSASADAGPARLAQRGDLSAHHRAHISLGPEGGIGHAVDGHTVDERVQALRLSIRIAGGVEQPLLLHGREQIAQSLGHR
jgi:hypothetical protein